MGKKQTVEIKLSQCMHTVDLLRDRFYQVVAQV